MNLLLAETNAGSLILIIVLLVACVGMFVLSYIKNKKYMQNQQNLLNDLQIGSKVLTKTFIYGTVENITETTDGKIVLIKTGEGDKASYLEMNIEAIYSIDTKEEVVDVDEVMNDSEMLENVENENQQSEESVVAFQTKEEVASENEVEPKKSAPKRKKSAKKETENN